MEGGEWKIAGMLRSAIFNPLSSLFLPFVLFVYFVVK